MNKIINRINKESNSKLDIGCGNNKLSGYIGIDILDYPEVDIVDDYLNVLEVIEDSKISTIHCSHFLEHISNPSQFLTACSKVLKQGGTIQIDVPHFSNPYYYSDPTHVMFYGLYTFSYLAQCDLFKRKVPKYYNSYDFKVKSLHLVFKSSPPFYLRHIIKKILGYPFTKYAFLQEIWEEFLSKVLPAYEMKVILVKL